MRGGTDENIKAFHIRETIKSMRMHQVESVEKNFVLDSAKEA